MCVCVCVGVVWCSAQTCAQTCSQSTTAIVTCSTNIRIIRTTSDNSYGGELGMRLCMHVCMCVCVFTVEENAYMLHVYVYMIEHIVMIVYVCVVVSVHACIIMYNMFVRQYTTPLSQSASSSPILNDPLHNLVCGKPVTTLHHLQNAHLFWHLQTL